MSSTTKPRDIERKLITRAQDIPDFGQMSKDEEATWWETHELSEDLLESGPAVAADLYAELGIPNPTKTKKSRAA
jgi:hypothetical protein